MPSIKKIHIVKPTVSFWRAEFHVVSHRTLAQSEDVVPKRMQMGLQCVSTSHILAAVLSQ